MLEGSFEGVVVVASFDDVDEDDEFNGADDVVVASVDDSIGAELPVAVDRLLPLPRLASRCCCLLLFAARPPRPMTCVWIAITENIRRGHCNFDVVLRLSSNSPCVSAAFANFAFSAPPPPPSIVVAAGAGAAASIGAPTTTSVIDDDVDDDVCCRCCCCRAPRPRPLPTPARTRSSPFALLPAFDACCCCCLPLPLPRALLLLLALAFETSVAVADADVDGG